jgi:hypothetical protein
MVPYRAGPNLPVGLRPRPTKLRVAYVVAVVRFRRFWATIFAVAATCRSGISSWAGEQDDDADVGQSPTWRGDMPEPG